MTDPIAVSVASARRERASCVRDAEEAAGRARELRALARVAGRGPEAEQWQKRADFLDQVEAAQLRQVAELDKYLQPFGNVRGNVRPPASFRVGAPGPKGAA
jgi:hypothetical protein